MLVIADEVDAVSLPLGLPCIFLMIFPITQASLQSAGSQIKGSWTAACSAALGQIEAHTGCHA